MSELSSAEMTAYWRAQFPEISGDSLSLQMATSKGIERAKAFEEELVYPKIGRHISARAGFFLQQAVRLLSTGQYDACISLGSGFSLLSYYIAEAFYKKPLKIFDVDIPSILQARKERIGKISDLDDRIFSKITLMQGDIQDWYRRQLSFSQCFPECKSPLFILEGIIYFLNKDCIHWLFKNINSYSTSAVLLDYWPEDGPAQSSCFKRVVDAMQKFIPENLQSFLSGEEIKQLLPGKTIKDYSLQEVEKYFCKKLRKKTQLNKPDEIILARMVTARP